MAYDTRLADRMRSAFADRGGVTEKKMFGGIAFMLDGRMFVGISGQSLMARVGPDDYEKVLSQKHVRPMDFTGRPMKGYVYIDPSGLRTRAQLERWLKRCAAFVATLGPKSAK